MKTCAHLACRKPRTASGLCRAHHALMLKGRSIAHPIVCAAQGCDRDNGLTNGYCGTHSMRVRRHGSPLAHVPIRQRSAKPRRECTVNGCTTRAEGKGLCKKHRTRLRRYGSVELLPNRIGAMTHPTGLTTRQIEAALHNGATLAQVADHHLIHPRALRLWLERIGRDDLLRKDAA